MSQNHLQSVIGSMPTQLEVEAFADVSITQHTDLTSVVLSNRHVHVLHWLENTGKPVTVVYIKGALAPHE